MSDDFVTDVISRIQRLLGEDVLSNEAAMKIEAEVRQYWGGDRPYIGKTRFDIDTRNQRDLAIWKMHHDGERIEALAIRFELSHRHIRRIVQRLGAYMEAKRRR